MEPCATWWWPIRSIDLYCGFYRNYQGIRIIKVPEKVTWHYLKTWKTLPDFGKSSTFAHVHSFINGPQWTLRPSPRSFYYVPFIIIFENSQFFNILGFFYISKFRRPLRSQHYSSSDEFRPQIFDLQYNDAETQYSKYWLNASKHILRYIFNPDFILYDPFHDTKREKKKTK